jgi:hypothetical protein
VLSDGSQVVEVTTTDNPEEEYYVQIQGSDRKYPAILLRRKDRGEGATFLTISKFGKRADLYAGYESVVNDYLAERAKRLDNSYNSKNHRESEAASQVREGDPEAARESWVDQTIESVVNRPDNTGDNS